MKLKKLYWLTGISIVIGLTCLWLYWRFGGFIELDGTLVGSSSYSITKETEAGNIYSLSLGNDLKLNKFFDCEATEYEKLSFPTIRENDFICAAKRRNSDEYAVLQIRDGKIIELMTATEKIAYPVLRHEDSEIIYIAGEKNQAYLYKYDLRRKTAQKVITDPVDAESRVQIASDGSLMFVTIKKYSAYESLFFIDAGAIELIDAVGNRKRLAEGRFPVWYEEGKSLFYYDNQNQRLVFHNNTSDDKKIIKEIRIESQLVISPDKNYIAFDEGINMDGAIRRQLIVVPVDGRNELSIRLNKQWLFGGLDGVNWIGKEF